MLYAYILGNIVGRILVSYTIVWVVCLLISRFKWRPATRLSVRWYCLLAVLLLVLLGLGIEMAKGGG